MNSKKIIVIFILLQTVRCFDFPSIITELTSYPNSKMNHSVKTKMDQDNNFLIQNGNFNLSKDIYQENKSASSERHLFPFRRLFGFHIFEGRGIKDMIGIVSTILAALFGAILVKLNILIVLSVISVVIGKLLLLITAFKSHSSLPQHQSSGQWHPTPIIISSEKIRPPSPIYYQEDDSHHHHPSTGHLYRSDDNMLMYTYN